MGHTPIQTLRKIKNISFPFHSLDRKCTICPLAKHHVLPFLVSIFQAKSKFELIHLDVWGPYRHSTINKCTYFLTIVDDFSIETWTYLLPSKHHVFTTFQTFHKSVENQYQVTVKTIRTDNGTEFINSSFATYLQNHGITHKTSCPYTPQQMQELKGSTYT